MCAFVSARLMPVRPRQISSRGLLVLVGMMLLLDWAAVKHFYIRELLPTYPRSYDQASYLGLAIDLYRGILDHGVWRGLVTALRHASPQGQLVPIEVALAFLTAGANRVSALGVNMLHFVLLQGALIVLGLWQRRVGAALAIAGIGASAALISQDTGGLQDLRLDFAAFGALAAVGCLIVRTMAFRERGWSILAGVGVGLLGLTRLISMIFVVGGAAGFFLLLLWPAWRGIWQARMRLVNLIISLSVAGCLVAPVLLSNWPSVVQYYVVGHGTSNERHVRAIELGLHSTRDHLLYYPRSVMALTGRAFWILCAALLLLAVMARLRTSRASTAASHATDDDQSRIDERLSATFLSCVIVTMYVVLTSDLSKSPIVGAQFVAVILPLLCVFRLWPTDTEPRAPMVPSSVAGWPLMAGALLFLAGHLVFVTGYFRHSPAATPAADTSAFMQIVDDIVLRSQTAGQQAPVVSFDELTDFFNMGVLKVLAFERHGINLTPQPALGRNVIGLGAVTMQDAQADIERSDFVVIGHDRPVDGNDVYPVNQSLRRLAPTLYAMAARDMIRVRDAAFFGRQVTLFARPVVRCQGESGGWISDAGLVCQAEGSELRRWPIVELQGSGPFYLMGSDLGVTATTSDDNGARVVSPCQLSLDRTRNGSWGQPYVVRCDVGAARGALDKPVQMTIVFNQYFVPRDRGINADVRRLVAAWPTSVSLRSADIARGHLDASNQQRAQ